MKFIVIIPFIGNNAIEKSRMSQKFFSLDYEEYKNLRKGYKERLNSGYYTETDANGNPRTDLHDEYDEYLAYKNRGAFSENVITSPPQ